MTDDPPPRKIILDTDPGVGIPGTDADDPLALMLALADDRIDLLGVTTVFGNCPPDLGARGALRVLHEARADIPVAVGMDRQLSGRLPDGLAEIYAGPRGRTGDLDLPPLKGNVVDIHAIELIIELVKSHPGEVTILAIGPHTNVAMALLREPTIANEIDQIVFMGGAIGLDPTYGRGNITPVAECNMWFDPLAADLVFRSGIPLTMVSLDVTNPNTGMILAEDAIRAIDPHTGRLAPLVRDICSTYLEAPMFDWVEHGGCVLYDPLAVAVAADPDIAVTQPMALGVETHGALSLGQTVPIRDGKPNVTAVVDVDGPVVAADILTTILSL